MDNKIRKIWYLVVISLVIVSCLIYIFKNHIIPSKTIQDTEIQTIDVLPEKQATETKEAKIIEKTDVAETNKLSKKREVKQAPHESDKQIQKSEEEKITEEISPQKEEQAINDMKQIKTVADKNNRSETVEIRYMYKSNMNNNVYYRGVWYNIKTKSLDEQANVDTTESNIEMESKE